MQRLMHVSNKMNKPFQSFSSHGLCKLLVAYGLSKLCNLCHHAIEIWTVPTGIKSAAVERNINKMPRSSVRSAKPDLISPNGEFDELGSVPQQIFNLATRIFR